MTDETLVSKFTLSIPAQPKKSRKVFAAADGCNEGIVRYEDTQFQIVMNMRRSMRLVL